MRSVDMLRCPLRSQTYPSLRTVANEALRPNAAPRPSPHGATDRKNEVEASVARRLRTPPEGANPQDLIPSTITALRGEGHRSIVVVGNYKFGPMTAEPCRAKDSPLHSPSNLFRPRQNPHSVLDRIVHRIMRSRLWWRRRVPPPGPKSLFRRRLSP